METEYKTFAVESQGYREIILVNVHITPYWIQLYRGNYLEQRP